MTTDSTAVCDQRTAEGAGRAPGEHSGWARDRQTAVARQEAGGRLCAVRADLPGLRQRHRKCVRPRDPRILTGWSGASPHVLRFPPRAFLRFPVCPPGSPPSPAFLWFPVVRRSPVSSPSAVARFRFPFGVPPGSLPLSNLHHSAAAGRFRRRWSRAARAKVTSPAATPRLDLAVSRPARQMGSGWAQWDAATESPLTSGRERRTPPRPNHPDRQGYCLLAARGDWSR